MSYKRTMVSVALQTRPRKIGFHPFVYPQKENLLKSTNQVALWALNSIQLGSHCQPNIGKVALAIDFEPQQRRMYTCSRVGTPDDGRAGQQHANPEAGSHKTYLRI